MPLGTRKKPYRLVFLMQDLFFGGTQRHTLELVRRLNPSLFQAEIWLMMAGDDFVPWAQSYNLPLTWLGRGRYVWPTSLVRLWRRLRQQPVDLLVLLTGVPNIWGRLLGRLTKMPLIVGTLRGTGCPDNNFEKWMWPLADHFLCNAMALKKLMMDRFQVPEDRLTVVPNGVDLDFFHPSAAPAPQGKPVVLCIARLVPEKDHETLITAFSLVVAGHPQAELWLVGDGPRRRVLSRLANRCLPPHNWRFIPGQIDISPILQQGSLLVLSSLQEGFPNVVLEAMAAGLPVVATGVGGVSEIVKHGETGCLVAPKDPGGLADAISHLLTHEVLRLAFGQAGRKRAEDFFSMATTVAEHEKVFLRLINRERRQ